MSDDPPILMKRLFDKLVPASALDADHLRDFPVGKSLRVRITMPRNVGRLRLYWAVLKLVHENMDSPPPIKRLHEAIKVRLGYTETIRFKGAAPVVIPASIAFDKMSEPEFAKFFDRFKDFVTTVVIPGLDKPALEAEALEMLGELTAPVSTSNQGAGGANNPVREVA